MRELPITAHVTTVPVSLRRSGRLVDMGTDLTVRFPQIQKEINAYARLKKEDPRLARRLRSRESTKIPHPILRWLGIARSILEHITWRREWVTKDRLDFIRQFTREGIKFFVKEGLEEWREPLAKRLRGDREGPLAGWLAGS